MPVPASRSLHPRLPVLIGAGQLNVRVDRGEAPVEPVEMLARAARRAAADAGAPDPGALLAGADTVGVVQVFSWRYRDPAALVAARIGAAPRRRWATGPGGHHPQSLVNRAATDIAAGRADLVVLGGAEAWRTRMAARAGDVALEWTRQGEDAAPTEQFGDDALIHPDELARGLAVAVQHYPIFESALRAAGGRTQAEHQVALSELWARFSAVAAGNPDAWIDRAFTAAEIRAVGPANRMIGHPYPKLMNANNSVEQAAALVLCSVERARALGVPTDRWVFPWAGTDASDTTYVSHRRSLHRSPAMRHAGRAVLALAGVGVDDLAHVDVYSCFPSAVQVAAAELGLSLDRPLTVTGGLSFAGGPWNNYVTHAIATLAGRLRSDPGSVGLATANGGYLTKHAFGVYAAAPPPSGRFAHRDLQAEVDAEGAVELVTDWEGSTSIEGATVMHDRQGAPERAFVAVRTPDRRRAWATSADPDVMGLITLDEPVGTVVHRTADGDLRLP